MTAGRDEAVGRNIANAEALLTLAREWRDAASNPTLHDYAAQIYRECADDIDRLRAADSSQQAVRDSPPPTSQRLGDTADGAQGDELIAAMPRRLCERCGGSGQISDSHSCFECSGKGYVSKSTPY